MLSKNTTTLNLLDQISEKKSNLKNKKMFVFNNTSIKNDISQKSITCDISLGSGKNFNDNEEYHLNK
jgi:hypothetical protein